MHCVLLNAVFFYFHFLLYFFLQEHLLFLINPNHEMKCYPSLKGGEDDKNSCTYLQLTS